MFTNPERKTNDIPYKFIVVCDEFTKPIAHSISNRAIEQEIESVVWMEKDYKANEGRITNRNYVLFLNEKNIKVNLADPTITPQQIIPGVLYKKQGHQAGIYNDKNTNSLKMADHIAKIFKEDWGFLVLNLLNGQASTVGWLFWRRIKNKKAKFYLLMKAVEEFNKTYLLDYVQGK